MLLFIYLMAARAFGGISGDHTQVVPRVAVKALQTSPPPSQNQDAEDFYVLLHARGVCAPGDLFNALDNWRAESSITKFS